MPRRLAILLLLAFAGCATGDALLVNQARERLVGMTADDLRLCAGIPDREAESPGGIFWTYDRGARVRAAPGPRAPQPRTSGSSGGRSGCCSG